MLFRAAVAGALILAVPAFAAERPSSAARPNACAHHGPGFAPIPGTDTCVRVSGRVRSEVDVGSARSTGHVGRGGDGARLNAEARAALDARTETGAGPLRTVVRVRARRGEPSPR